MGPGCSPTSLLPTYHALPPWEPPPAEYTANPVCARKALCSIEELWQHTLMAMAVHPDSGRTGAATITTGTVLLARTSDHCSMLQTDLVAIQLALKHAQHHEETTMVLHIDSRAGLQVLQQHHPSDNVGLVTAIMDSLQSLVAQGRQVRLNWILRHVGVRSNKAAEAATRRATEGPHVTRPVPLSQSQVKEPVRCASTMQAH